MSSIQFSVDHWSLPAAFLVLKYSVKGKKVIYDKEEERITFSLFFSLGGKKTLLFIILSLHSVRLLVSVHETNTFIRFYIYM